MCRLCCLRCAFEWNGRRMSTACALLKHWRRGQVEVAIVYGPVLEPWQSREIMVSEFQMVFVSDGFGIFWQCSYLSDRSCSMPRFGTVEVGVVCDGLGRLWCFVLQWWEEIRRGRGGFAPRSVRFVCSRSAEASYKRWLCPFVSPDPKWEAFRGQRVSRASCLKRRRVLVGWSFIQVLLQGFASVILDRIFSEVPGVTVCLVFSCAFDAWEMWALLTLYESMALLALRFQLTQLFRHGLGTIFCHGQINLKPIKFQRESWKTMEGHECQNTEVRIWIGHFFVDLDASTKRFSRPPQVQLNYAFDKLPWWSLRTTGSLADASYAERSDWCRTCWPIAAHRQWTRQRSGKVKTTLPVTWWYSGTATQHWTFHGIAYHRIEYMIFDVRLQMEELRVLSKFQWVASFTVTQCHMDCRGFTILSAAAYLLVPLENATMQPLALCVDWAAHEPGSCCQDGTSCDRMWSW